jgi:hypothetical protein
MGNRCTVEGDKSIAAARARLMDGTRNDLFARAGFSLDQNGRIHWRNHVDVFEQSAKFRAGSD